MTPPVWRSAVAPVLCAAAVTFVASCDNGRPAAPVPAGEPVSTPAPASTPATTLDVDDAMLAELEKTLDEIDVILEEIDTELAAD